MAETPENLKRTSSRWQFQFAWDESPWESHCHHQKYFYTSHHGAFVGGMVLCGSSTKVECHGAGHDTFVELSQGSEMQLDVRANFVARWNDVHTRRGLGADGLLAARTAVCPVLSANRGNRPLGRVAAAPRPGVVSSGEAAHSVAGQLLFSCPGDCTYSFRPNGERSVRNLCFDCFVDIDFMGSLCVHCVCICRAQDCR